MFERKLYVSVNVISIDGRQQNDPDAGTSAEVQQDPTLLTARTSH
jgi:hypothetical protein